MKNLYSRLQDVSHKFLFFTGGAEQPVDWNKEVGGIEDDKQAVRKKTYEKLNSLSAATNERFKEFDAHVFKSGETLSKVLAEKFGEDISKKGGAPETFYMLKLLVGKGLNVDKFRVGDTVDFRGGKFTVGRVNGTSVSYEIFPPAPEKKPVKHAMPIDISLSQKRDVVTPESTGQKKVIYKSDKPEVTDVWTALNSQKKKPL